MEQVLTVNALTKIYGQSKALDGFSMHIPKGAIYGFVGKNGSGKTTLIRLICGLQTPTAGEYTLYGIQNSDKRITKARRRMGAVVETPSIYLDLSAEDNLKVQYRVLGLPTYGGITELLDLVGLADAGNKKAKHFSLGMRQRLGLAQAIMENPKILILDEPFNGLDKEGVKEMREYLLSYKEQGKTILICSHSAEDISVLCETVHEMDKGRIEKIS
jgi:ABC-2 type transport system ATP-binding protein